MLHQRSLEGVNGNLTLEAERRNLGFLAGVRGWTQARVVDVAAFEVALVHTLLFSVVEAPNSSVGVQVFELGEEMCGHFAALLVRLGHNVKGI